jgi:hypothetical protein
VNHKPICALRAVPHDNTGVLTSQESAWFLAYAVKTKEEVTVAWIMLLASPTVCALTGHLRMLHAFETYMADGTFGGAEWAPVFFNC